MSLPVNLSPDEASPEWMNKGDNAMHGSSTRLPGGPPEHSGPGDTLWQLGEEEMGSKLCLHCPLCLCSGPSLQGWVGLQNVIW